MRRDIKLCIAASALAMIAATSACKSAHAPGRVAGVSSKALTDDRIAAAFANQARKAMVAGRNDAAIQSAERAVYSLRDNAEHRLLLGQIYLASGRFASADQALGDMLMLDPGHDKARIAQALARLGQNDRPGALAVLGRASPRAPAADLGLAYALAGQPQQAISILEPAARLKNADARVRQNLALSHALAGDWAKARAIAAQDLSPGDLDQRLQSWAAIGSSTSSRAQVAAFIGMPAAPYDPGQPAMLALRPSMTPTEQAFAEPGPVEPAVAEAAPIAREVEQIAIAEPVAESAIAAPQVDVVRAIALPFVPVAETPVTEPARNVERLMAAVAESAPPVPGMIAPIVVEAAEAPASVEHASVPTLAPSPSQSFASEPALSMTSAIKGAFQAEPARAPVRAASATWMVQLGAYSRPAALEAGWERLRGAYARLERFDPTHSAVRRNGATYYRLAVGGFASRAEALSLCQAIKGQGRDCFIRRHAGDEPMQLASANRARLASR